MPEWLIIVVCVVAFFILRGICMAYFLWRANVLSERQRQYVLGNLPYAEIAQRKTEITRLWRVAHLKQAMALVYEPAPFGQMTQIQASVWDNVHLQIPEIQKTVLTLFEQAIGYFKDEVRRSFIPVFWPSVAFNLFGDVLVYIGVSPESAAVRVANLIGGLAAIAGAVASVILIFK